MNNAIRPRMAALAIATSLLTGCMVGPNYKGAPDVAGAASQQAFHRADALSTAAPAASWWKALDDAQLDRLIDDAFGASPDLQVAEAKLQQSRASLKKSRAGLLPSTGSSALYMQSKGLTTALGGSQESGSEGSSSSASDTMSFYDVGFDATWEIDLFGGQRRAVQGARAREASAIASLQDAHVSLAAEVADAYVTLRELQGRVELAQQNIRVQSQMLALEQARRAGGTATDLDVERLGHQLESTRAQAIPLQAQIAEQLDRLAILTGRLPGQLDAALASTMAVPLPPVRVDVGDPASMLRRRPDVREAEQSLIEKNALVGQRTADLFPKVELLGTVGYGATEPGQLFKGDSLTYIAVPLLQWSPFDFGRTRAGINEAKGEYAEALASYRKTVLGALQDAETSLARFGHQRESVVSLAGVLASAERTSTMTQLRAQGGTATTLDQLDVERQRVSAQSDLLQAKAQLTRDYIALQKSLGLGWAEPG
ncbi:efflux transporter outer membrane subunit [Dyella sp. C9]|uniref:efflux transporter outer membrane subunit n=1 Tax=Dyella sp. C9 TaxID=2202154 RepID=UPI000DEFC707|nr:efflux transporter outer membrane subunit [Dyella sp. C9]